MPACRAAPPQAGAGACLAPPSPAASRPGPARSPLVYFECYSAGCKRAWRQHLSIAFLRESRPVIVRSASSPAMSWGNAPPVAVLSRPAGGRGGFPRASGRPSRTRPNRGVGETTRSWPPPSLAGEWAEDARAATAGPEQRSPCALGARGCAGWAAPPSLGDVVTRGQPLRRPAGRPSIPEMPSVCVQETLPSQAAADSLSLSQCPRPPPGQGGPCQCSHHFQLSALIFLKGESAPLALLRDRATLIPSAGCHSRWGPSSLTSVSVKS